MSTALKSRGGGNMNRSQSRLRMYAPSSIQIRPPSKNFAEWKVAIPLLSPLDIVSFPLIEHIPPSELLRSDKGETPPAVAAGGFVNREWRHPAEPFYCESSPANSPAFTFLVVL